MEPFYFFFEFLRALFNFEARAWTPTILACVLFYVLYHRNEAKKYKMTVEGYYGQNTNSAKYFWLHHTTFFIESLPRVYLVLVQLDYKKISILNQELVSKLRDRFSHEDYLDNLSKIRNILFSELSHTRLMLVLDSRKAARVNDFVRQLKIALVTSFAERLALWILTNDIGSKHNQYLSFEKLKNFSDVWKKIEQEDSRQDNPELSFIAYIKQSHPDLYKNIHLMYDYVSPKNNEKRYQDCLKKLLDFPDIGSVSGSTKSFDENLVYFCGEDYANNPELKAEARKALSKKLIEMLDSSKVKDDKFGVKNIKELFDIFGKYVVPADLSLLIGKVLSWGVSGIGQVYNSGKFGEYD